MILQTKSLKIRRTAKKQEKQEENSLKLALSILNTLKQAEPNRFHFTKSKAFVHFLINSTTNRLPLTISSHLYLTTLISLWASAQRIISTTLATVVFVLLANFYKTNSVSVFQDLKELLRKEFPRKMQKKFLHKT